ncbi:microtubule-associated tumor suppressor candidate 2 homolog [Nematolebias whitei]|uniref:microtubule-associated tumor suppressor candidate 2 homolog n=1 Tax=Nematolebias whitei TaxID=451745 RepID=UPI00189A735B|nr:microtubule-associated tumor suppressor candidate 2 homolog [Nematolebias whitei]
MSIPTSFHELRVHVDRGETVGNKTLISFTSSGNSNQIKSGTHQVKRGFIEVTRFSTSSIPPLVCQRDSTDKIVICGSEQQCMEPELREFEHLDYQEIHTFSRNRSEDNEQEENGESYRNEKESPMSLSSSSTASSASVGVRRNDNSNKMESRIQMDKEKRIGCHSTEEIDKYITGSREKMGTQSSNDRWKSGLKESKSETNVFVSSLTTVALSGSLSSALNSSGVVSLTSLSKSKPSPNVNNATSAHSSRRAGSADANRKSPQEKYDCTQYCSQEQILEERNHRNGLSSDGVLGGRRKAQFEERMLPPRRQQIVRPLCQIEMGRGRNLTESELQEPATVLPSTLSVSLELHTSRSNKKFAKLSLREPSDFSHLYNNKGAYQQKQPNQAVQKEAATISKHPSTAAQFTSDPSNTSIQEKKPQTQLTYRKNCSSPNRTGVESKSTTPPQSPPRTPQGFPHRPSMYLISRNVSGVPRHAPAGSTPAIQTSACYSKRSLGLPVKTNVTTSGVPKVPPYIQQSSFNSNPKESSISPKLKPKGVRPKIITYVRKNPQFTPPSSDRSYQVSSLPSRLSTSVHRQIPTPFNSIAKDPSKTDAENLGVPVLNASNVIFNKYCQEMQVNSFPARLQSRSLKAPGHTNTGLLAHSQSHNQSPKQSSRVDNLYVASKIDRSMSLKGSSAEDTLGRTAVQVGGSSNLFCSGRGLRLGLGAVTRSASVSAKNRAPSPGQRSAPVLSQQVQPVSPATSQKIQDNTVWPGLRAAAAVQGSTPVSSHHGAPLKLQQDHQNNQQREKEAAEQKEKGIQAEEREKVEQRQERLQGHGERQERQLKILTDQLKNMSLGLDAFIIVSQHYCLKNETAEECQRKLSLEILKMRQDMTSQALQGERLEQNKAALDVTFEHQLQDLQLQQEAELAALEEKLRKCHTADIEHLKVEQRTKMEERTSHQQEQMEEMTANHQAAIEELRDMHDITMATLHEEHTRTMRDLRKAHEQQKSLLEEDFQKQRLSLQDQVDTLTFQNESLKDKVKCFEEALKRSSDEQIIDALVPYQHIEQDLKSLKEVVEMKNQQIHQQEKKISDLEKVTQKNMFLEEKVQVLQQQNEDLMARIDMNLATSRQLSEENANLQESVEKENTEKKRLSQNNDELLWLLHTSPLMSPASSPLHRSFSTSPIPLSPLLPSSSFTWCDSPTHCHGCPNQAQYCSPSHRAATNQNLSPRLVTPTHRAAANQNYPTGPNTPTHRALASYFNANTSLQS